MENMFLKSNVKMEPLIWKWYAWSHSIPPLNAACNIAERHIKIMESFIQFPKIHMQAVKNPQLMGGPFIDLADKDVDLVKELLKDTKEKCKNLIELNTSLKDFEKLLKREAIGNSLEPFYPKLPENLRGLVELVYDTSNNPSIRIIESLIYKKYYEEAHQGISLSFIEGDKRSFVLSTPRVKKEKEIYLDVPFANGAIDRLFESRYFPQNVASLINDLKVPSEETEMFHSLFTDTPPSQDENRNYKGDGIRIRFFGHACILLQTDSVSILVDPMISYPNNETPRFSYYDLPDRIDYVLLTHNHQDHVLFETLLQIRHKISTIIVPSNRKGALEDPSLSLILKNIGFKNVIELGELETIKIVDGEITGFPFLGEHSDLNIQTKLAHLVTLKDKKFLLAADSNNLDPHLYDHLFSYYGGIDVLFVGMECDGAPLSWLYGPYLPEPLKKGHDDERTLSGSNFEKAWSIVEKSQCKEAYVYAMGMEPWLTHIMALQYTPESIQLKESDRFVAACKEKGITSERLYLKKEWVV